MENERLKSMSRSPSPIPRPPEESYAGDDLIEELNSGWKLYDEIPYGKLYQAYL